ncbi:MAG: DNA modification methylase [Syntrophales bacterium]
MKDTYKIETIPISQVHLNEKNPRLIKDAAFNRLVKSLQDSPDLFRARPLLCSDRTGKLVILGGNMRYLAAKKLKYSEVPVIIMKGLTEDLEKAIIIRDNGTFGEWDFSILANEWADLPLEDWGIELPEYWLIEKPEIIEDEPQIDRAAELQVEWGTALGQIWQLGQHRLMCGNSTRKEDVAALMGEQRADMVFTDPPYNVNYGSSMKDTLRGNKRKIENDNLGKDFERFLYDACVNMLMVTNGAVYICMSSSELHTLQTSFREAGGHWSTFIIWAKNTFTMGRSDYQRQYEPILYGWKESGEHHWCGARDQGDVWFVNKPRVNDLHPTMKPVELCAKGIENSSPRDGIVMDLFLGSGSTLIACEQTNRICYSMELDPAYVAVTLQRWKDFTGGKPILVKNEGKTTYV